MIRRDIILYGSAVVLILLISLFLRIWDLGEESFWSDEAYTVYIAQPDNAAELITGQIRDRFNPPLYYFGVALWTRVVGVNEFTVRLPSALLGTLLVAAMMWVGWMIYRKRSTMLFVGVLAATSWYFVEYSQEARSYAFFLFLAVLHFGILLQLLRSSRFSCWLVAWTVSAIAGVYTHFGFWALIIADLLLLMPIFFRGWNNGQRWMVIAAFACVGIAFAPWFWASTYPDVLQQQFTPWQQGFSWDLVRVFVQKALFIEGLPLAVQWTIGAGWMVALGIGSIRLYRQGKEMDRSILLLLVYFVATIIFFGGIWNIWMDRYLLASLPFFYLIVGGCFSMFPRWISCLCVAIFVACSIPWYRIYYDELQKEPWREVAAWVASQESGEGLIVVNKEFSKFPWRYYYHGTSDVSFPKEITKANLATLTKRFFSYPEVIIIYLHPKDPARILVQTADRLFLEKQVFQAGPIEGLYFSVRSD